MNTFHRTAPEAPFTGSVLCTRPTLQGRTTLSGSSLTIAEAGARQRIPIRSVAERDRPPREHFGICTSEGM